MQFITYTIRILCFWYRNIVYGTPPPRVRTNNLIPLDYRMRRYTLRNTNVTYTHTEKNQIKPSVPFQIKQMTLLNGGQRGGDSPTKLRVLGAARKSEVKATQNLSIIVAFFAVCWMPLYTINCVQAFCDDCPVPAPLMHGCIILSHLNSAGNPLLYAYHLKDFRNAFRSLLLCKKSSRHRNAGAQSRSGCTTVVAAVTGTAAVNGTTSQCSVSSSLTCSGSSSRSMVVDCWRRSAKNARSTAADAASCVGDAPQHPAGQDRRGIVTIVIDPSTPVLLSVRQLVE